MSKRILLGLLIAVGGLLAAPKADAAVYVRGFAPVRRVAARAVLPPYPLARRAVVGPVVGYPVGYPAIYGSPVVYGPGIVAGYGH